MRNTVKQIETSAIPFVDVKTQDAHLRGEILSTLQEIIENTSFVLGPQVEAFESAFAHATGTMHCVGVNSGTSALHLALIAAGVGAGHEVITVPMTFAATLWAIRYVNAKPVFVDIDPGTYTIDVEQVEARITLRTKAIIPVHLYGQPADLVTLQEIAERHGLALIEDAAQAHGATYHGKPVGSFGQCGCFSFYPGKNLGAYGEAGAIVTNNTRIAQRLRALRDHAQSQRYHYQELGFNYRMDAFQGAVLAIKLPYLEEWIEQRCRIANSYRLLFEALPLIVPQVAPNRRHAWHLFVLLHPGRLRIRQFLEARGIQTRMHYPIPLHLQKAFADLGHRPGDFPVSERVANECFSLPISPGLTQEQQSRIGDALLDFFD
ncbi:MAG: DegT/DnrJ/EryC1/StrS family aminotransferase [Pirellulaceae bacterium]|nr:DegT/DnrJ/EryC1/StrS family aminotransferase [Pirellulaceae bacterium]